MAKQIKTVGGYVRLDLRRPGDFGYCSISGFSRSEDELCRDLEGLAEACRENLSKFDHEIGSVVVEYETEAVCEHCGAPWSEDGVDYNGGCCERDQEPVGGERYLIWSNEHGAWWRPNSRGYTINLEQAGRYSYQAAIDIASSARDGWPSSAAPPEIPVLEADALTCAKHPKSARTSAA